MWDTLTAAEGITWLSVCVKALVYATTLIAAGSVLALVSLKHLSEDDRRRLRRMAIGMALLGALVSLVRLPIRASFLMGGTWAGAADPMVLGMVAESPLGASIAIRLGGLALILALALPRRAGLWIACCGAVVACASFVFRGHALEEPRHLLGGLITLHLLGLAFWIGALLPLMRAARHHDLVRAGAMAHDFGQKALWVVGGLVLAGAVALGILVNWTLTAGFTPYGQYFAVKLCIFAGILSLAAVNKMRLTPALGRGDRRAAGRLVLSIRLEALLIGVILLTTAALTTVSSPPMDAAARAPAGDRPLEPFA